MTLATPSWSEGVLAVVFCPVRRDQDRRNDKRLNRFLNCSGQRLAETVGPTGRSIVIQLLRLGDAIELGANSRSSGFVVGPADAAVGPV